MFDDIARKYFSDPDLFASAMKLLRQHIDAREHSQSFAEYEEQFLSKLDSTENETALLEQAIRFQREINESSSATDPDKQPRLESNHLKEILSAINNHHRAHVNSIPLKEAFDKFLVENQTSWSNITTGQNYRNEIFNLFYQLTGDISTGDVTKEHVQEFKELILKLPSNRSKKTQYKDKTARALLKSVIPENDQISATTKKKYLNRLSSFISWLYKNNYCIAGLTNSLSNVIRSESITHEERKAYTCDDLRKLFNSRHYTTGLHKEPYRFWVPLIGLFTGARLNEICQLYVSDIYQHEDSKIWVIDINDNEKEITKKSVKRPDHRRLIPIHRKLIHLGLIEFAQSTKTERLFPELTYNERNKYGYKAQKWFNTTYTNQANCNIQTPNTAFHSLRHNLETYLANKLEMPIHKIETMMGQKPSGGVSTGRYIKPIELQERSDYINKVNWDHCIDFKAIRPWKQQAFARNMINAK
ncbi:site-specific integrase [Imhoffiella purpurea]|nr:site-specific integrase [Imhoffiella purpurea]